MSWFTDIDFYRRTCGVLVGKTVGCNLEIGRTLHSLEVNSKIVT